MMVNLAAGLRDRGVRVDLVLADASGPFLPHAQRAGLTIVDLGRGSAMRALPSFARYLRHERPQVIVTTLHHTSVVASLAHLLAGRHGRLFIREATTPSSLRTNRGPKARVTDALLALAYRYVDGVLAVSDGVCRDLHARGVPLRKIATLYNPVVTAELRERAAEDPGHRWFGPDGPRVVLGVGRLRDEKGFSTLLAAFARVRKRHDARLVILGEGEERARLEALASDLGVASDVDLPGFVDNPYAYMARSAVFVLASEREGLPGALIQAMACGCPVVATDCQSGPAEILAGGRLGALVPVGDVETMAAAIARTLVEPPNVEEARRHSLRYSSERIIAAHVEHVEAVLSR
ncbi:glycosyltransferase [soil metagenome]